MGSQRSRQKKIEKQKKKRAAEKKRRNAVSRSLPDASAALAKRTAAWPVVAAYLSVEAQNDDPAALVSAVLVRGNTEGRLVCGTMLIDRTCLGLKDGFARESSQEEIDAVIAALGDAHGEMEETDVLTLQSVVFHAVDYARSLGFEPQRDLPIEFLGERPAELKDTPLAKPTKPFFLAGPYDDIEEITGKLALAVGAEGFEMQVSDDFGDDDDDDAADDEDDSVDEA